jgi:PAS domain S-box-containing protein
MTATTLEAPTDIRILAGTFWTDLPESVLERMVLGARVRRIPARGTIFGLGDPQARAGILLAGSARAFLAAADGRQLTVQYLRRGSLVSRRSYLLGGHSPVAFHAVTDVEILDLDTKAFLRLINGESSVASAVLADLSRRLEDVYATAADSAFGTLKEKIARHLLALTGDGRPGHRRIAPITQQELADGVGTKREVAARALRELRADGIVATGPGYIEVLEPARLGAALGAWQVAASAINSRSVDDIQAMLEASPTPIVAVSLDGAITHVNSLVESLFGWPRGELVGRMVETLIPERLGTLHLGHRAGLVIDPVPRPMSRRSGLRARRRDGSEFAVAIGLSTVETRAETLVLATIVELAG